ncbi:MAG: preprotein translocase subunit YajC [Elusimicrobiales bacterium]|nr:preprotein translocase subunit YajC [Elusimicrobiales bacterium]MCK5106280.1 preprotein translocase subunit YajC [Elusimicrobiales bacterium]MCK5358423.1 preprotein translocase subunit YajC [Elusimicrobiales bacterium]
MSAASPGLMNLAPLIIIMIIFYFLLIRPQQKQMKERKIMLEALKSGDKILSSGGIFGTITAIRGDELEVEIASNVKVVMARSSIANIVKQTV